MHPDTAVATRKVLADLDEIRARLVDGDGREVPYEQRLDPLARRFPHPWAWCVVKDDSRRYPTIHGPRAWPGCAFLDRTTAEAWAEFLADYYYGTDVRDGQTRWEVRWMQAAPSDVHHGQSRVGGPVGAGYYPGDRSRWVGSLPMRLFEFDRDSGERGEWLRLPVTTEGKETPCSM